MIVVSGFTARRLELGYPPERGGKHAVTKHGVATLVADLRRLLLNGGELAILYCFVFLYLAFAGGGAWSLDRRRGKS